MEKNYDFVVIGGGSAGYAGASTARQSSHKIAIIDGSKPLGGLCILRGCMPSKTLIYAAEILHLANKDKSFGLDIPSAKANMAILQKRKQAIISDFANYRTEQLESDRHDLYRQNARFLDPNRVQLDDGTVIVGGKFLIATGSTVHQPPLKGLDSVTCWTSDDILELDKTPESVIVLGGGIVACELSQFLNRIGAQVIQIQRSPHVLKEASGEAAQVIEQAFRDEGIELYTGTAIKEIMPSPNGVRVIFDHGEKEITCEAAHLFNALGRKPATDSLNLDKAGIKLRHSGHIETDLFQRTANPDVYAAGDCAGPHEIVHIAILQAECAARHAFGVKTAEMNYDKILKVVFTDPQVATSGLGEKELGDRNIDYLAADYPFDDHGKSILMEAKYGYVKLLAQKPGGIILGAECVGKDAGELIHAMSLAIGLKATAHDALKADWYHPTLSEIWTYPLEEIAEQLDEIS